MARPFYLENVTIGSDPELFIVNTKTNTVVSSIGLIPGKKKNAFVPENFEQGFGLQTDNVLAEFNIPPINFSNPDGIELFVQYMEKMKNYIRDYVKSVNPDYDILCSASELVPEDQLNSEEAMLFGCDPDYNAYTLSQNDPPRGATSNLRTTGCHIHVGYNNNNINASIGIIKVLDLFLGVPSVLIDKDTRRRSLYGKAGCFRITDYGVEYRVLSGYFINNPELIKWMYSQTFKALDFYNRCVEIADENGNNFNIDDFLPAEKSVMNAINNGRLISAKRIIAKYIND